MVQVIRFVFAAIGIAIRWTVALALWTIGASLLFTFGWMVGRSDVVWTAAHWNLAGMVGICSIMYILLGCYTVRRYLP